MFATNKRPVPAGAAASSPSRLLVRLLADLGHTDFLHVAGDPSFASARNRRQAFLDTVGQLGARGRVVDGYWSGRSGYDAIKALPDDTAVTAVVAANHQVATGVVRAALERGWRVPDDLSVRLGRYRDGPVRYAIAVNGGHRLEALPFAVDGHR